MVVHQRGRVSGASSLSLSRETRYSRARARHRSRPRDARANGVDGPSDGDDSLSILSAVGNRLDEMDDE